MTEQVSALADNEIALENAEHLLATMQPNSHASEVWSQYHLIGDVMRGAQPLSANFKQNLMAKIELEPTVLAPNAAFMNEPKSNQAEGKLRAVPIKSKPTVAWSIAASFAAVMVVGWMVLQTQVNLPSTPVMVAQVAQTPSISNQELSSITASLGQAVPDEYLMAHQETAPSASSYYIQAASFSE